MRIFWFLFLFAALSLNPFCANLSAQDGNEVEAFTIKLDPIADINPVKTQHTMIATVLDSQGRPLPNQRVDWILSRGPMMVGDIVEHDDMGAIVGSTNEVVKKLGNHYSISYTNEGPKTLTMGTETTSDDIALGVGQTWMTITSPVEGETHVIAFCPSIRNANQHKAFAIKYWIDAKISWPENAVNKVGDPHTFNFNLVKASSMAPMTGYLVRWSLIEDPNSPKAYLNQAGNAVVETETDEEGNSSVVLNEEEKIEGYNKVRIELRKPTGELLAVREVTKQWISPKIQIAKTGPAEGILNENVVFNVVISNPGAADANGVVVKDKIQEGFEYVSCDVQPDSTSNRELVWNIGTLPKDAVKRFTLTLKATTIGSLKNTAVVLSDEAPPQTATAIVSIGAPEVYIVKEGMKEIRLGEVTNFQLRVKNNGNAVARDVVVRDTFPEGLEFRGKKGPMTLRWPMGNLQPQEEKTITYSLTGVQVGSWNNEARAYVKDKDVHKADFTTLVVAPDLKLTKNGPRLIYLHRSATYTIKLENMGNGAALNVQLIDTIPEHLDFISANPRGMLRPARQDSFATVTWSFDEIPANSTVEIKLEMRGKKIGQCVNSAKAVSLSPRSPKIEPLISEVSTKIIGVPAMHISTYDTEDPLEIDKQTIYVIETRNEGTSPCTNVKMESRIPAEMEFVEAEGPCPHEWDEAKHRVVFQDYPILQPGDKLVYKVRCKAAKVGSAKNTAILRYDQFEQEIIDEEGTSIYE